MGTSSRGHVCWACELSGAGLCKVKGDVGKRPTDGLPEAKAHRDSVPMWQGCLTPEAGREWKETTL